MGIKLYFTSVTANMETKKNQQKIIMVLDSKKIPYEEIDISSSEDAKAKMREVAQNEKALPPQISNDDTYCGDYDAFELAVEDGLLEDFLKL